MAGTNLYLDFEGGEYSIIEPDAPAPDVEEEAQPFAARLMMAAEAAPIAAEPLISGRAAVEEAANIARIAVGYLLAMPKQQEGRTGSNLRAACNYIRVYAEQLIATSDQFITRFGACFTLALSAGASLIDFENVRRKLTEERPISVLGIAVKQAAIRFCLENEALALNNVAFVSRQDVEKVQLFMREAFAQAIESAADDMEQQVFQTLTALAAAVQFHLYDTARPLPRVVRFQFAQSAPTLIYAYRLYQDAGRADEMRQENKTVHPAFARRSGLALSA